MSPQNSAKISLSQKVSQGDVMHAMGRSRNYVNDIGNGKTSQALETTSRPLAKILDVKTEEL